MLRNVTRDVFSDMQPAWSADSEYIYFVSDRGDVTDPGRFGAGSSILADMSVYQTDLYRVSLKSLDITPITNTRLASETQPAITQDGDVYFISDANGIPNVWVLQAEAEEAKPVTNVESGIAQISVSKDGSRLALNGLNEGYLDIFVLRNPASRIRTEPLPDNLWAQERASMSADQRVAALGYTQTLITSRTQGNVVQSKILDEVAEVASSSDSEGENEADDSSIDFRNYVFSPVVAQDSTLKLKDDPRKFEPENKETEDGYYQPKRYQLTFSPDFSYASGGINTYYGTSALATFSFSDLFGDHRVSISSNLVLDLRNSTYSIQYGYFKQRTNYFASFFHQAQNYQTFSGELLRFRTYGFGVEAQYPLNKFQRIDYGLTAIGISRDFSSLGGITNSDLTNETSTFLYPQVVFTGDFTVPGFITPQGGSRYTLRASGSPPLGSETPQFVSLLGDYRKYLRSRAWIHHCPAWIGSPLLRT
jgi:Periplasmic component of the Tol biopolymer transport system